MLLKRLAAKTRVHSRRAINTVGEDVSSRYSGLHSVVDVRSSPSIHVMTLKLHTKK